jgi:cell division protease FtsH
MGVLLHGPSGTGKTLLAKAVAYESNAKFYAPGGVVVRRDVRRSGSGADPAPVPGGGKHAPAIVFIDELDAVGATRDKDISGEKDQTLNRLLVEMDGFSSADNIVVIAASNLLDSSTPPSCARAASTARSSSLPPTSPGASTPSVSTRTTSRWPTSTSS